MDGASGGIDAPPVSLTLQEGSGGALWPGVLELRRRVFGDEQAIVDMDAPDPDDEIGIHVIATVRDGGERPRVIGAGRITLRHMGRNEALVAWLATDREWRRRGIGQAMMETLLDEADMAGIGETVLAAQRHAERFYGELGFIASGHPYKVRGIPHRWMVRKRPEW